MNKEKVIFLCLTIAVCGVFAPFAAMYTHRAVSNWWYVLTNPPATNITVQIDYNFSKPGVNLTHTGVSAHTALQALESVASVSLSVGGFIETINGITSFGTYYWAFYHNGAAAMQGAAETLLATNDVVLFNFTDWMA